MTSSNLKSYHLIDAETGETKSLIEMSPDYKIIHQETSDAYKKKLRLEELKQLGRGKSWVACYHEPIKNIVKEMSFTEAGALLKLLPYLQFRSEGKMMRDGKYLGLKEIEHILGKGKTQTRSILQGLEKLNVLIKVKQGRSNIYFINKLFHTMGEVLEGMRFTKLYQKRTKEILDKLKLNEAGLLYKILPYCHYSRFALCENPDEEDINLLNMLTREELASLIGHEPETVSRYMKHLEDQGVLLRVAASKAVNFYIHPDVMFRKAFDDDETEQIRKWFDDMFNALRRSKKE